MDKAKKFKLNIMKAFEEEEERRLHKSVWGAMIEDEITPDEPPVVMQSRDVSAATQIAAAPVAQLNAGQASAPETAAASEATPAPEAAPVSVAPEAKPAEPPPVPEEAKDAAIPVFQESKPDEV